MGKRALFAGLLLSISSLSCASQNPQPAANKLQTLEYFLRMEQGEYPPLKTSYSFHSALSWLIPAAQAELPPEYQTAFSLLLTLDHTQQTILASYHSQMVIDDASHKAYQTTLTTSDYQKLIAILAPSLACSAEVEPGWAGPSPSYLRLSYLSSELLLYVGGPEGPAGPGDELRKAHQRRYLCSEPLKAFLNQTIQNLKAS